MDQQFSQRALTRQLQQEESKTKASSWNTQSQIMKEWQLQMNTLSLKLELVDQGEQFLKRELKRQLPHLKKDLVEI